ncbi:unnamed protein product, partial [Trypanosoma congolense IL3000]
KEIGRNLLNCE